MGRRSREKGAAYEREIAATLKRVFPVAARSFGQSRAGDETPDIVGTPWWIECTHGKAPNILGKMRQGRAATAATPSARYRDAHVVVFSRRDRKGDLVTMPLSLFLALAAQAGLGGWKPST